MIAMTRLMASRANERMVPSTLPLGGWRASGRGLQVQGGSGARAPAGSEHRPSRSKPGNGRTAKVGLSYVRRQFGARREVGRDGRVGDRRRRTAAGGRQVRRRRGTARGRAGRPPRRPDRPALRVRARPRLRDGRRPAGLPRPRFGVGGPTGGVRGRRRGRRRGRIRPHRAGATRLRRRRRRRRQNSARGWRCWRRGGSAWRRSPSSRSY